MSDSTISFSGPPSSSRHASAYRTGKAAIEITEKVIDSFSSVDNVKGVDLNLKPGTVVLSERAEVEPTEYEYVNGETHQFSRINGQLLQSKDANGKPQVSLQSAISAYNGAPGCYFDYDCVSVRHTETDKSKEYFVRDNDSSKWNQTTVIVDKETQAMAVTRSETLQSRTAGLDQIPDGTSPRQASYPPEGPADVASSGFYLVGKRLTDGMERNIQELVQMDNGPQDLNPQPGVVVVAGFHREENGPKLDASVHFDPNSKVAQNYETSCEGIPIQSYTRSAEGVEDFQQKQHKLIHVTRQPDGATDIEVQSGVFQSDIDERNRAAKEEQDRAKAKEEFWTQLRQLPGWVLRHPLQALEVMR